MVDDVRDAFRVQCVQNQSLSSCEMPRIIDDVYICNAIIIFIKFHDALSCFPEFSSYYNESNLYHSRHWRNRRVFT
jgi:hypothetical protein